MARYVTVQATFGFGEKIMIERAREPAKRSASLSEREAAERRGRGSGPARA